MHTLIAGPDAHHYAAAMTTRTSFVALLVAAAAVLTACAGAPSATSPTPTRPATGEPAASSTPEPTTPSAAAAAELVIGPGGIDVLDASGMTLFAASYGDPLAEVLTGLETALGAEPVRGTDPGHIERLPYDTYTWDGLRLGQGPGGGVEFDVQATGDATGAVRVRTPEGIAIGSDADTVRAAYPDRYESWADFDIARSPGLVVDPNTSPPREWSIAVYLAAPPETVTRIFAPADNQGP